MRDGEAVNLFSGNAGVVVQFRDIYGDMHFHLPPSPAAGERAAHALAEAVFRQWREEAKVWDVGGDRPLLAVEWRARERRVDHPENVGGVVDGTAEEPGALLTSFLALPQRRLAILGGAGSGKTALAIMLTLDLLKRRLTGADATLPVPVLLSLSDWDPDREEFGAWLVRRVTEDYPGLPRVDGRHPARALWQAGPSSRLLPVLDGLDEMPRERQAAAVRALNRALYEGHPLIITSRTEEFDALARHHVLRSAAAIEAQQVAARHAVDYLRRSAAPETLGRWESLFTEMLSRPDGPAATALSTPLMLWLARTVHARPWSEPARLADPAAFPTRQAVEDHLLDAFVPAVFSGELLVSGDRMEPPRRWAPARARRWLRHLAGHAERQGTTELAWWRLHQSFLPRVLALPALVLLGLAVSETVARLADLYLAERGEVAWFDDVTIPLSIWTALLNGVTLGLALQLLVRIWYMDYRFGRPRRQASPLRMWAALRSAAQATTPVRAAVSVLLVAAVVGLYLASAGFVPEESGLRERFFAQAAGLVAAAALTLLFAAPSTTEEEAVTPGRLMRGEHMAVLFTLCVTGPVVGLALGGPVWREDAGQGLALGAAGWLGAVTMLVGVSPWSRWLLARGSLALTGRVPWSLMRFMKDARAQGVLRETGGTYQFRNIRLQRRLAAGASTGPAAVLGRRAAGRAPVLPPDAVTLLRGGGVEIAVRQRRLVLGPLLVLMPAVGLWTLQIAARDGTEALPVIWAPAFFLFSFGGLFAVTAYVMPRRRDTLRITPDHIECGTGRWRRERYAWQYVEEVAVRRTRARGVDTRLYGVHVRLHPGAPRGRRVARSDGPWYVVSSLGLRPVLPWQTEAALRHFAAERWRPPALSSLPDVPTGAARTDWAHWERELRRQGAREEREPPRNAPPSPALVPRERALPARTGGGPLHRALLALAGAAFAAATVPPLLTGLADTGDFPGWAVAFAFAGLMLVKFDSPAAFAGGTAAVLRVVCALSAGLSAAAALAVTAPPDPDPLSWTDLAGIVVLALGLLICGARLLAHATRRTRRLWIMGNALTGLVLGYAVAASAAAPGTPGLTAFLAYVTAVVLFTVGFVIALFSGADGKTEQLMVPSGTSYVATPPTTPGLVAWYVLVAATMLAGSAYAALAGGSVVCWVLAVGGSVLGVPVVLGSIWSGQRAGATT
ncbi:NACHT domain-containing protein [Streptomyces marincola]|uniref:NACHT domain-containing protein n=1 Tax=Streptomyces marincola TaxID=2878388 RepID=A0A1W7D158_9ACTN|nr:NACHT domain-containing protein [Streptomyces marincola]ARQ70798.1 hypothetical protein CAG99_19875 [Streptomyces marincola]